MTDFIRLLVPAFKQQNKIFIFSERLFEYVKTNRCHQAQVSCVQLFIKPDFTHYIQFVLKVEV